MISLSPEERPKKLVQPAPPPGAKKLQDEYWCPYCAQFTKFEVDRKFQIMRCTRCGISDQDFYVKTANHLWGRKGKKNK